MNHTCVVRGAGAATVIRVVDKRDEDLGTSGALTLTALGELVGMSQPHMSLLVREGLISAPAAEKGRRRAVPAAEVRRVLRVVQLARIVDVPALQLFRALGDGRGVLLADGRIALGSPSQDGGQLVA